MYSVRTSFNWDAFLVFIICIMTQYHDFNTLVFKVGFFNRLAFVYRLIVFKGIHFGSVDFKYAEDFQGCCTKISK